MDARLMRRGTPSGNTRRMSPGCGALGTHRRRRWRGRRQASSRAEAPDQASRWYGKRSDVGFVPRADNPVVWPTVWPRVCCRASAGPTLAASARRRAPDDLRHDPYSVHIRCISDAGSHHRRSARGFRTGAERLRFALTPRSSSSNAKVQSRREWDLASAASPTHSGR
jgi:hypothetical protein